MIRFRREVYRIIHALGSQPGVEKQHSFDVTTVSEFSIILFSFIVNKSAVIHVLSLFVMVLGPGCDNETFSYLAD